MFLTLNGTPIPIAEHRDEDVPIGEQGRNAGGELATAYTDVRRDIQCTTTPLTRAQYESWVALLRSSATLTAAGDSIGAVPRTVQGEVLGGPVILTASGPRYVLEFVLHW